MWADAPRAMDEGRAANFWGWSHVCSFWALSDTHPANAAAAPVAAAAAVAVAAAAVAPPVPATGLPVDVRGTTPSAAAARDAARAMVRVLRRVEGREGWVGFGVTPLISQVQRHVRVLDVHGRGAGSNKKGFRGDNIGCGPG